MVKVLRSSGLTDETLGNAWQEASQAILLDTDSDPRDDLQMEDAMEWRDFIILLDTCYRMSTNDLKSFMKRFSLPSARSTAIRGKKNPFQAKPASDYPSPMVGVLRVIHLSSGLSRELRPWCPRGSTTLSDWARVAQTH